MWGVGCGVWDVVFGVWGVGCELWGVGCGVWGVGCGVWREWGSEFCQVQGFGFRVSGFRLGFRG